MNSSRFNRARVVVIQAAIGTGSSPWGISVANKCSCIFGCSRESASIWRASNRDSTARSRSLGLRAQAEAERGRQALRIGGAGILEEAHGQAAGIFEKALVVEQGQRLQRRVGAIAARTGRAGVGSVEYGQTRGAGAERQKKVYIPRR